MPNGDRVGEERQAQQAAAQPVEVDLQSGEQEQEGEPDGAQHLHGLVEVRPAEGLRADRDPEQDLQHDRRQSQPREADRQRSDERNRGDHGDRREADVHAAPVPARRSSLHRL
jgi:hypothetical protein